MRKQNFICSPGRRALPVDALNITFEKERGSSKRGKEGDKQSKQRSPFPSVFEVELLNFGAMIPTLLPCLLLLFQTLLRVFL